MKKHNRIRIHNLLLLLAAALCAFALASCARAEPQPSYLAVTVREEDSVLHMPADFFTANAGSIRAAALTFPLNGAGISITNPEYGILELRNAAYNNTFLRADAAQLILSDPANRAAITLADSGNVTMNAAGQATLTGDTKTQLLVGGQSSEISLNDGGGVYIHAAGDIFMQSDGGSISMNNQYGQLLSADHNGVIRVVASAIHLNDDSGEPLRVQIADPLEASDAATKGYVDTALAGVSGGGGGGGFPVTGSNGASITQDASGNVTISGNQVYIKGQEMAHLPQTLASDGNAFYIIDKNMQTAPIWIASGTASGQAVTKAQLDTALAGVSGGAALPINGNNVSITNPSPYYLKLAVADGSNGTILLDAQNGGSVILRGDTGAGGGTLELDDRVALYGAYGSGKIGIDGYGEGQDGVHLFSIDPIWVRDSTDTSYQRIRIADGIGANDAVTKAQLDAAVAGVSGGGSSLWTQSGNNIYYNSGNVGIGTASPRGGLEIYNSSNAQASWPRVILGGATVASALVAEQNGQTLEFGVNYNQASIRNTSYPGAFFRIDTRSGYIGNQMFSIFHAPANGSEAAKFKLSSSGDGIFGGKVGIGKGADVVNISAPAYALDVTGDINLTGDIRKNGVVWNPAGGGSGNTYREINAGYDESINYYPLSDGEICIIHLTDDPGDSFTVNLIDIPGTGSLFRKCTIIIRTTIDAWAQGTGNVYVQGDWNRTGPYVNWGVAESPGVCVVELLASRRASGDTDYYQLSKEGYSSGGTP
jgi:hypothetical protein